MKSRAYERGRHPQFDREAETCEAETCGAETCGAETPNDYDLSFESPSPNPLSTVSSTSFFS